MECAILPNLVNGDDVRMIQSRGTASLLLETTQPFAVFGEVSRQQFERHLATQNCILRQVDLTHAARAQRRQNSVAPDCFPKH